jgi:hypothetical protein
MPYPNRSFIFSRTTTSHGFLKPATISFELRHPETEALVGSFEITGRNAEWIPADKPATFRIRRDFWGRRWNYAGAVEGRLYAKLSSGFFRRRISFAEGGTYTMKSRRGSWFSKRREFVHRAEFFNEDELVMTLTNHLKRKLFSSDAQMPMKGTIESALPGMTELWGALLMFQSDLYAQQAAAA